MKYALLLGGIGLVLYLISRMQASVTMVYMPGYGYVPAGGTAAPGTPTASGVAPTTPTSGMPTMGVAGPSASPTQPPTFEWGEFTGGPGLM